MAGLECDTETLRQGEFWALDNVSFDVGKGEVVGIVGQNGSGKSTLLRAITGIYPPDKGRITIRGRIGALISVGAGFHPHMSGRENIYLNGTILGMTREQIASNLDDIIAFAELGESIDAPVSTYSSGMTVRLGFAIAVHSFPEILLADEILAVGDLQFALKCYRKLAEYKKNGGTLILVSHIIQQIRNFCTKVLWLDRSVIRAYGETQSVCDEYEAFMLEKDAISESRESYTQENILNYDPLTKIERVSFLNAQGEPSEHFISGQPIKIRLSYNFKRVVKQPVFTLSIFNSENIQIISNYSIYDRFEIESLEGTGAIDFLIENFSLKPSRYKCMLTLSEDADINKILEWHDKTYSFNILPGGQTFYGVVNLNPKWTLHADKAR
jgi:ABC-type polysaccharide/polyol phosphate transport system ATPase subunit